MFEMSNVQAGLAKQWKTALMATTVMGTMAFGAAPASAGQDACESARSAGLAAVAAQFSGAISSLDEMASRGVDLSKVAVEVNGQFVSLAQLRAKVTSDQASLVATVNAGADRCNQGFEPYQQAADALVTFFSGGLNLVLPAQMFRVDVSQILGGYPLGGPNAIVPQIRETALRALGISGTLERIIVDPVNTILGGNCSFVRNPFQRGC